MPPLSQPFVEPRSDRIKVLVVLMMACAIGCVVLLSMHRPGTRITILHDYWSQPRIDSAATVASFAAARKRERVAIPSGKYMTVDRVNLGDRSLKSRFDLLLSDVGTFNASRTTSIGRDEDDRVAIQGQYKVVGGAIEFVPEQGPIGLFPVDGVSIVDLHADGSMTLVAGELSILLHRVAVD